MMKGRGEAGFAELGAGRVCAKEVVGGKTGVKNVFLCKFSIKAAGKRNSLTVDVDFGKIIDIAGRKLCFLESITKLKRTSVKASGFLLPRE